MDNLDENDYELIKKGLKDLNDIAPQVKQEMGFSLGFTIDDDEDDYYKIDEIKKAFVVYKFKFFKNYKYSEFTKENK